MKKTLLVFAAMSLCAMCTACGESSESSECDKACTGTCMNGVCVPEHVCTAGEVQCNGNTPQKCANNAWVDQTPCGANQVCKAGNCELKEQTTSCTDGAVQCAGNTPQKCVKGEWLNQAACASGQKCEGGACKQDASVVCTDNAKQCSTAGVPQKCVNNAWVDQTACASGQKCQNGDCAQDAPADTRPPRDQLKCEKDEHAKCQTTSDGHTWAVTCHDGDVEDDDWVWPEDCTAVGLQCVSERVSYPDGEGTYTDAWCKCNSDADCDRAYPGEGYKCIDNYCDVE